MQYVGPVCKVIGPLSGLHCMDHNNIHQKTVTKHYKTSDREKKPSKPKYLAINQLHNHLQYKELTGPGPCRF